MQVSHFQPSHREKQLGTWHATKLACPLLPGPWSGSPAIPLPLPAKPLLCPGLSASLSPSFTSPAVTGSAATPVWGFSSAAQRSQPLLQGRRAKHSTHVSSGSSQKKTCAWLAPARPRSAAALRSQPSSERTPQLRVLALFLSHRLQCSSSPAPAPQAAGGPWPCKDEGRARLHTQRSSSWCFTITSWAQEQAAFIPRQMCAERRPARRRPDRRSQALPGPAATGCGAGRAPSPSPTCTTVKAQPLPYTRAGRGHT